MKTLTEYLANTSIALLAACFLFIGLALVAAMGPLWLFWFLVLITFGLAMLTIVVWAIVSGVESAAHWSHEHGFGHHHGAH
jgi:hypothetical protein